ncbi:MAG TPA: hypothetical protein VMR19_03020 [Candidatus Saccharimonadales bacterium]|jgi:hypothetical protein|nr:hypothetical protein [Candidatus Saccharimonadales bacterium]
MGKEQISYLVQQKPPFNETQEKLDRLHVLKQELDDELSLAVEKVELTVNFDPPFRKIPISDIHLFSPYTNIATANYMFKLLEDENTFGVIMGDMLEGANSGIMDHAGNLELPFGQQIRAGRKKLEPYIKAGKILCMSTGFDGHEGWGMRYSGIDVVELLAEGFVQPDGSPLQVLTNGGRFILHFKNGEKWSELIYHSPGGGGSDEINPVGAQRERLREYANHRAAKEGPIDSAGGGHMHHRAGVAKELIFDLNTAKEKTHVLYANGTTKGNDPARQDPFLTRQSKGPTLPPGVQLILNQPGGPGGGRRNGEKAWISYGFNKGEILYDAAKLWDAAERQKSTQSIVGEIVNKAVKPKANFDRLNSRATIKERRNEIPIFEKFNWKIESSDNLPITVYLLAHTRYGSTSFRRRDRDKFIEIINHTVSNPYEYVVAMRHFADSDLAKDIDRKDTLNQMIDDLLPLAKQDRLLGFMMSSSLLTKQWLKDVKAGIRISSGFRPGDYIYRGLQRRVPLYHQSLMNLKFGRTDYSFLFLDHLSHSGSEFDMFRGLVQARRKMDLPIDIVAGGHMLGAGFLTTPDATYIAPGWFSDYDSRGRSNQRRAPLGGQGVILLPDTKVVIPFPTFLEGKDTHTALMLLKGLNEEDQSRLLYRRR